MTENSLGVSSGGRASANGSNFRRPPKSEVVSTALQFVFFGVTAARFFAWLTFVALCVALAADFLADALIR